MYPSSRWPCARGAAIVCGRDAAQPPFGWARSGLDAQSRATVPQLLAAPVRRAWLPPACSRGIGGVTGETYKTEK